MESAPSHAAALRFQDIDVERTVGIRRPFRIEHFCDGINLVHGPNGIGKTRTAIALQALIWPISGSDRAEIGGTLAIGAEHWRVDLDGGQARYQRNGVPETARVMVAAPADHRDRYLLTLTDLLRADNRELAREIAREAAGGYDLERARHDMGIATAFSRPRKLVRELQEAEDRVAELRQDDHALQAQEQTLDTLRAELSEAISASERIRLLELARAHADALTELAERTIARDVFPEAVRRMTGDEYDSAKQVRSRLSEARTRQEHTVRSIEAQTEELTATGFAGMSVPHTLIVTLRDRLEVAQRAVAGIEQAERQRGLASTRLDTARRRLAEITEEQLATFESEGLREFSRHVAEMRDLQGTVELEERVRDWLGEVKRPGDIDTLRRGVVILQHYLGTVRVETGEQTDLPRWLLLGAAIVIVLEAIGLAIAASSWLLLLALLAAPLVVLALRQHSGPGQQAQRLREDFAHLGLPAPGEWRVDEVQDRLSELQREVSNATLEEEKFHRWDGLAERRQEAQHRLQALKAEHQALLERYGGIVENQDPASLRLTVESLQTWRRAQDDLAEANATHASAARLLNTTLAAINSDLQSAGGSAVTDVSEASAAIEALSVRAMTADKLTASLADARHRLVEELQPEVERWDQQLSTMYESLGLEANDDAGLKRLCNVVDDYKEAHKAVHEAEAIIRARRAELQDDPGLLDLSREEIDQALASAEMVATQREGLQARIIQIETKAQDARHQTRLEDAIASEAQARDALATTRQRECEDAAARKLFSFIQDRNHRMNRPVVLKLADQNFTRFTIGAYTLTMGRGHDADFLAVDTATGRTLTLDQLSSGTRIHLLLAVRLAFIEAAEQGTQLPIMLDEVLGNTDDERATAIIDAAIEIARQGRQVLYFTAQQDEIGKWRSRLEAHDDAPKARIIDFAAVRNVGREGSTPDFAWDRSIFDTPEIDVDITYAGLHDAMGVAPIDFWAEQPDGCSVWYFITDVPALLGLHRRGVQTWGQYRALARGRHLDGIGTDALHENALARALVVQTACREWRYGRPRPLTAECLRESDLITERFWTEVVKCAASRGWDGRSLIDALNDREVPRFQQSTTERLEEWLREHGHIVDTEPQPDALIRAAAISAGADAISRGVLAEDEIDELLMSMAGAPVAAPVM